MRLCSLKIFSIFIMKIVSTLEMSSHIIGTVFTRIVVPNLLATRTGFVEEFFHGLWVG